jgi:hypothetical protein
MPPLLVRCIDGGNNEQVDVVTPLLYHGGGGGDEALDGGGLLSSWRATNSMAPMPTAATGASAVR